MPSHEDDPYAQVARSTLKLKNDEIVSKKKKRKQEKKKKLVEVSKIVEEEEQPKHVVQRTKAELAFLKMQEKMKVQDTFNRSLMGILSKAKIKIKLNHKI
ncbi:uncharacterized protein LOC135160719 isoform X2 [Diachasmimorpha longicaudata]|uniref:uncharacterized protein LOC135160719 isoform X2 n=1 Tax=Diachasmimorpha longicaudata TaxID=58733 RepID=UPI0030B88272